MSNDARQRDTFLSIREVVCEAVRLCTAAEETVTDGKNPGDNGNGSGGTAISASNSAATSAAIKALRDKERALVAALETFLDNAPEELLKIRVQYMPVPRPDSQADGPHEAAARMTEINHQVTRTIDDMADKVESEDLAHQLEGLQRQLASLARHASMASVTMHDV